MQMIIETIYDQLNLYAVEVVADYIRSLPQGRSPDPDQGSAMMTSY